jgi:hypothetical protein
MSQRWIGQEAFAFGSSGVWRRSSLDDLRDLIDWAAIERQLAVVSCSAKGEPAWPPLALFKAMLLAMWYDLSDVKLAEALDDRASFRRYCGFSTSEATPERTTFVRFRKALVTWRRRSAGWTARRCVTGSIASTRRDRKASSSPPVAAYRRDLLMGQKCLSAVIVRCRAHRPQLIGPDVGSK